MQVVSESALETIFQIETFLMNFFFHREAPTLRIFPHENFFINNVHRNFIRPKFDL